MSQSYQLSLNSGTIDRTMPVILEGHITPTRWSVFCDDLEQLATKGRGVARTAFSVFGCLLIAIAIIIAVTMSNAAQSDPGDGPPVGFFFIPVLMVLAFFVTVCLTMKGSRKLEAEVNSLCQKISDEHRTLSFHYKSVHHPGRGDRSGHWVSFIEIIAANNGNNYSGNNNAGNEAVATATAQVLTLSDVEAGGSSTYGSAYPVTSANATAPVAPAVAQRLADLESIKSMISAEEYKQKKKDIMDSI